MGFLAASKISSTGAGTIKERGDAIVGTALRCYRTAGFYGDSFNLGFGDTLISDPQTVLGELDDVVHHLD